MLGIAYHGLHATPTTSISKVSCQWDVVHSSVGQLSSFDQYCADTQIQVLKSAVLDSGIKDLT
jgi:hypothetical protein